MPVIKTVEPARVFPRRRKPLPVAPAAPAPAFDAMSIGARQRNAARQAAVAAPASFDAMSVGARRRNAARQMDGAAPPAPAVAPASFQPASVEARKRNAARGLNAATQAATEDAILHTPQTQDVGQIIGNLTDPNSMLMRQSETEGYKLANRRGLINSTIAVGAAQNEAYKAALPLAQAQLTANTATNSDIRGIAATAAENRKERSFTGGENALERASRESENSKDRASREVISRLDRKSQLAIASMNLDAADRSNLTSALSGWLSNYEQQVADINSNKLLKPEARTAALADLKTRRDAVVKFWSDIYDVDISWPGASDLPAPAGGGPAGGGAPTNPRLNVSPDSPNRGPDGLTNLERLRRDNRRRAARRAA
jgi:hypothetical protein